MSQKKIVIVDDYEESCKALADILQSEYECSYTSDSAGAFNLIKNKLPNLILLDYQMPGVTGIDVLKQIRSDAATKNIPIIFVSGAANIDERANALEVGADDFVSKPFHMKELIIRIRSRLNEAAHTNITILKAANLEMDLINRKLSVNGAVIDLTPTQFDILKMLVQANGQLVTRDNFLSTIWGNSEVTSRNVDSQINYLKKKIEHFTGKIIAVPGQGYRLEV